MPTATTLTENDIIHRIAHKDIHVEGGFNKRMDFGDLNDMADSLEENGMRRPLKCFKRGEKIILNDGERRYRGTGILLGRGGLLGDGQGERCPVIIEDEVPFHKRLITQFIENDGKPFTPIEEAMLFSELRKGDPTNDIKPMSANAISKAVGKSCSHVADRLLLCEADEELLELLENKKVGCTLVIEAVKTSKANGADAESIKAKQKEIARVAKKDKNAAKKLAITSADGSFYMRKSAQDEIRAAIVRANLAKDQDDMIEEALQAGLIRGICIMCNATNEDLASINIDVSGVRWLSNFDK